MNKQVQVKIKTVKDLTLQQIKDICNDHYPSCRKDGKRCPLYNKTISCDTIISVMRSALRHNPDAMDEKAVVETKEEKQMFKHVVFTQREKQIQKVMDNDSINVINYSIDYEFAIQPIKQIDEQIMKTLYEIYKDKVDELYVIDEEEFKKFINIYLPIYLKQRGDEDDK